MAKDKAKQRKVPDGAFRLRDTDSVGNADAADDQVLLRACFVDTGVAAQLLDVTSSQFLLVGRTGAGKTALLMHMHGEQPRSVLLSPARLAIEHVSNTTILVHLRELGVNLTPFYRLLWRHILAEEFLRIVAETKDTYDGL